MVVTGSCSMMQGCAPETITHVQSRPPGKLWYIGLLVISEPKEQPHNFQVPQMGCQGDWGVLKRRIAFAVGTSRYLGAVFKEKPDHRDVFIPDSSDEECVALILGWAVQRQPRAMTPQRVRWLVGVCSGIQEAFCKVEHACVPDCMPERGVVWMFVSYI